MPLTTHCLNLPSQFVLAPTSFSSAAAASLCRRMCTPEILVNPAVPLLPQIPISRAVILSCGGRKLVREVLDIVSREAALQSQLQRECRDAAEHVGADTLEGVERRLVVSVVHPGFLRAALDSRTMAEAGGH